MASTTLRQVLSSATDIILPPQPLFGGPATGDAWHNVTFLDAPCCETCGFPFEYDVGAGSLCGDCLARPPSYDRARAAFVYDDISRSPVLAFKHGGRTEGLHAFSAHMYRAGRSFWPGADIIIPVPLHASRLIKRRFNQSALLARKLARMSGVPLGTDALYRTRATPSQGAQTAAGRRRNVQGAFSVPVNMRASLAGKHIVLVDDVMTTGATINACARTLKKAGASYIDVITLARTVRQHTAPHGELNAQS